MFQVWDWDADAPTYTLHQYIVRERAGGWETHHQATVYRALRRDELTDIVRAAGFRGAAWHAPEESGYYQPILMARRYARRVASWERGRAACEARTPLDQNAQKPKIRVASGG